MPRYSKHPQYVKDCLTFQINMLKERGNLSPNVEVCNGGCEWSIRGNRIASIGYSKDPLSDTEQVLTFDYSHEGKSVKYDVRLLAVPSNLGKGVRWYFVCPATQKRCINLIKPHGSKYFLHREAFNLPYESQCQSKSYRELENRYGKEFLLERLYDLLYSKYRKKHYRGKPTPLVRKIANLQKKHGSFKFDISIGSLG